MPLTDNASAGLLETYLEKRDVLLRYFAVRARSATVAQDIVQELYFKITALEPGYRIENHDAFLFRLAQNIWFNHLRTEARSQARDRQWTDSYSVRLGAEAGYNQPSHPSPRPYR